MNRHSRPARVLDCTGLLCPEPVVRTRAAVAEMAAGEILEVVATDTMAELDLAVYCERAGHELIHCKAGDGEIRARIRVSAGPRPGAG